jgi:hypothetical protein
MIIQEVIKSFRDNQRWLLNFIIAGCSLCFHLALSAAAGGVCCAAGVAKFYFIPVFSL